MSVRDLLHVLEGFPPGSTVPVDWVRDQLEADGSLAVEIDYTLDQVGGMFEVSAETIRAACKRGEFPGAYRRAGFEWRIPPKAIRAYQEGEAERHALDKAGLKSARKAARCRARYKLRAQINDCARCGASPKRLEVHHKDGDPFNNEMENLEVLCVTCHRRHHDRVNGGRPGRRKRSRRARS